jgi:hypothetical protein
MRLRCGVRLICQTNIGGCEGSAERWSGDVDDNDGINGEHGVV